MLHGKLFFRKHFSGENIFYKDLINNDVYYKKVKYTNFNSLLIRNVTLTKFRLT